MALTLSNFASVDDRPRPGWRVVVGWLSRMIGLAGYTYNVGIHVVSEWPAAQRPAGFALLAVADMSVVTMGLLFRRDERWALAFAGLFLACSDILAINSDSLAWVATLVICPVIINRVTPRLGVRFVAVAVVAIGLVGLIHVHAAGVSFDFGQALGVAGGAAGTTSFGWSLRLMRERIRTAERLLAQEKETRDATGRAQVLDERARLAREIHDILAHTLSAQTVELEGVRLMLQQRADPDAVLSHVDKAQRLARDGLAETRRALASLRGDVRPPPETLRRLAADSSAELSIEEPVPELSPEVSVAVMRTVQEALTNARKHAPGAKVVVSVRFPVGWCEAEITDTGARKTAPAALAESGGGYGLAGMAERAELLGGHVEAGPAPIGADGKGFRVWLRIPT
jgi:signal transduction histidine kinase